MQQFLKNNINNANLELNISGEIFLCQKFTQFEK